MNILSQNETIIWQRKPKKIAFCLNKFLSQLPLMVIWLGFDLFFIFAILGTTEGGEIPKETLIFLIVFFSVHLFPVWKILADIFTAGQRWKTEEYIVTDKRIVIQSGLVGTDVQTLYYKDIKNVRLNVGLADKILGVGDIYFEVNVLEMLMSYMRNSKESC